MSRSSTASLPPPSLPPRKYCNVIRLGCSLVVKVTSLLVRRLPPYLSLLLLHLRSNTIDKVGAQLFQYWVAQRKKKSSHKLPGLESLHSEVCSLLGYILTYHMVSVEKIHMARSDATRKKDSVQYTSNIADLNNKQEYMYPVNKEVLWIDWLLITLSATQGASVLVTMVCGGKKIGD